MEKIQPRIEEIFTYGKLKPYIGLEGTISVADKGTFLGVEIELEYVQENISIPKTWQLVPDHSLKLKGLEFVSIPIKFKYLEIELRRLFDALTDAQTSNRCSVHIHLNVRDFTLEELHKFILLYCLFEKSLFNISGNRWKSNYTVPLYDCPAILKGFFEHPFTSWFKYTALNLSPIWGNDGSKRYGTIEFRHMEGTKNLERIMNWCNLIVSLKIGAKRMSLSHLDKLLKTMNTSSAYWWLSKEIFGDWSELITKQPSFKEDIESCITRAKFIFYMDKAEQKEKVKKEELIDAYFDEGQIINLNTLNLATTPIVKPGVYWYHDVTTTTTTT